MEKFRGFVGYPLPQRYGPGIENICGTYRLIPGGKEVVYCANISIMRTSFVLQINVGIAEICAAAANKLGKCKQHLLQFVQLLCLYQTTTTAITKDIHFSRNLHFQSP